jgi:hypothetical protein
MISYNLQMVGNRVRVYQPGYPTKILSLESLNGMIPHADPKRAEVLKAARALLWKHMEPNLMLALAGVFEREPVRQRRVRVIWVFVIALIIYGSVRFMADDAWTGIGILVIASALTVFLKWRT